MPFTTNQKNLFFLNTHRTITASVLTLPMDSFPCNQSDENRLSDFICAGFSTVNTAGPGNSFVCPAAVLSRDQSNGHKVLTIGPAVDDLLALLPHF